MPPSVFRADYDQLNEVTQVFDEQARVAQSILRDFMQRKQILQDGDWVGVAATRFFQQMDSEMLPTLRRLVNALQTAAQVSKAISQAAQQLEQDSSGIFKKGMDGAASGAAGAGIASAAGATGALAALGAALGNVFNNLFGGGTTPSSGRQDELDRFSEQLSEIRDMFSSNGRGSDDLFPSRAIMDAFAEDLASQNQLADSGWQQSAAGAGEGSGAGSGGGSGGGGAPPTETTSTETQPSPTGGGGGGGGSSPTGGGSMGAGANSQVGGAQGMVGANAPGARGGGGGGMFGAGGVGSLGAAVVAGITRSAAGAAPIAEVALMVGASAGGLLFAAKGQGGAAGWAAGQLSQNASSPIYRAARG